MKFFLDTEFYEHGGRGQGGIRLISIGLVGSDGRELYAENAAFDWNGVPAHHWLQENVRPHLNGPKLAPEDIRDNVLRFVGSKPEFWGWYCDYDWVVFCWLFGRMIDLPDNFPMFCRDLRQRVADLHVDPASLPKQEDTEHDALNDARWNRQVYEHLKQVAS